MLRNKTFALEFCSLISNWFDMREQARGQICCSSLFQEQAPSCVLKFACCEMSCKTREQKFCCATYFFARNRWCRRGSFAPGACCRSVLQEQAPSSCPSYVLVGVLTRMYWLGYLPRSVFQEQARSCVPAFKPRGKLQKATAMIQKLKM